MKKKKVSKENKIILGIFIGLFVLVVVSFGIVKIAELVDDMPTKKPSKEKETAEVKKYKSELKMKDNTLSSFDLAFLKEEMAEKNEIYSPLSIKYALAMLAEGSSGDSKSQIASVIGDYKAKKYTNSKNMSFANAIFIKNAYQDKIKKSYTDSLSNKYNAEVVYDSFQTAKNLNSWVSNKTFNLINDLFDDISSNDFILVNALAIDMEWKNKIQEGYHVSFNHENFYAYVSDIYGDDYNTLKFNNKIDAKGVEFTAVINNYDIVKELGEENIRKEITQKYTEWLKNPDMPCGDEKQPKEYVDNYIKELNESYKHVSSSTDFSLYTDENVKVFSKDLKEYNGTTLQYIGIMPTKVSLSNYVKQTNPSALNKIINNLKTIKLENFESKKITKVVGTVPLFKYDYELDLMSDLKKIGIEDVFNEAKADLSAMTSEKSYIGTATHKANIEFSNDGIKAAATTAFGGMGAAGCGFDYLYEVPVVEIDLTFDKPFMYIIMDKNTKEVWFVGTVFEPVKK